MGRGAGLKKIARLYAMVENLDALKARTAALALEEVTMLQARLEKARHTDTEAGRAALIQGSRVESLAGERTAAMGDLWHQELQQLGAERRDACSASMTAHTASKKELRQLERVIARSRAREQMDAERRSQAAADDRFLSRREWLRAQKDLPDQRER